MTRLPPADEPRYADTLAPEAETAGHEEDGTDVAPVGVGTLEEVIGHDEAMRYFNALKRRKQILYTRSLVRRGANQTARRASKHRRAS